MYISSAWQQYLNEYLSLGWRVLPVCGPTWDGWPEGDKGKAPLISLHDASNDPSKIAYWDNWLGRKYGQERGLHNPNWGWVPSDGLAVLDVDPRHGGDEALARLEAEYGPLPRQTPTARTGGEGIGWHYVFACPPDLRVKRDLAPGLTLASGLMVCVLPPSIHRSGRPYSWEKGLAPWKVEPAQAPAWLVELAKADASDVSVRRSRTLTLEPGLAGHPGASDGERNRKLCELVGAELDAGRDVEAVLEEALAWNERCSPPEAEKAVVAAVMSLAKKEANKNKQTTPPKEAPPGAGKERKNSAEPEAGKERKNSAEPGAGANSFFPSQAVTVEECDWEGLEPPKAEPILSFLPGPLPPEALHGLAGEIVRAVEPELEGDAGPVLVCLLCAVGSAIGPGPHVRVRGAKHGANLFGALVAPSGIGKAEPWQVVGPLMEAAEPNWFSRCVGYGLGSGEGLVQRLRDGQTEHREQRDKKTGAVTYVPVTVPGVDDKRCLMREAELGRVLTLCRREGSTLAQILCNAFDGEPLEYTNVNPRKATGHHVSIWGNITDAELIRRLKDALENENGVSNRFLWLWQSRRRYLPFGGTCQERWPLARGWPRPLPRPKPLGG
jgi:hypothetical protein